MLDDALPLMVGVGLVDVVGIVGCGGTAVPVALVGVLPGVGVGVGVDLCVFVGACKAPVAPVVCVHMVGLVRTGSPAGAGPTLLDMVLTSLHGTLQATETGALP